MTVELIALRSIPGTVQIVEGQRFYEPDDERAAQWISQGYARTIEAPNARGFRGLHWDGCAVAILASGPSLTEEQCEAVRVWRAADTDRRKAIAVNTTFRRAVWCDVLYACDGTWWDKYFEEAAKDIPTSRMWTQDRKAADKFRLQYIASERGKGLAKSVDRINQGASGGYQSMNLAYLAGAARMILLGFDCKGGHWHGDHPGTLHQNLPYARWLAAFDGLAADLKRQGIDVVNCSPDSAIRAFHKQELDKALT